MAGSGAERLPVVLDGKLVLAALARQVAQVEQGLGLVRIEGEHVAPGGLGGGVIALGQRAARLGQQRSGLTGGRRWRSNGAVAILVALAAAAGTGRIARRLRGGDGAHPRCAAARLRSRAYSPPCRTAGGYGDWRPGAGARRPGFPARGRAAAPSLRTRPGWW